MLPSMTPSGDQLGSHQLPSWETHLAEGSRSLQQQHGGGEGAGAGQTAAPPALPTPAHAHSPLALYQPVKFLGQGGFGFVVLSINKSSGEMVAIKFVECK